ncbi:DUF5908 family protein [uncultured Draconibacterium sp.]|uniref:DUF5908 family protein n=1 Tax=uncultured Draconibacterium sp. TaxID=1573823 RepID=UPI003261AD93
MPIEIKELHIKINVGEKANQPPLPNEGDESNTQQIIEACVEQVMEIIARKEER